jgi:hypothetical protein
MENMNTSIEETQNTQTLREGSFRLPKNVTIDTKRVVKKNKPAMPTRMFIKRPKEFIKEFVDVSIIIYEKLIPTYSVQTLSLQL